MTDRNDRIRELAYFLWLEEGCPEGQAERHWSAAEALLTSDEFERKEIEGEPPGDEFERDSPTTSGLEGLGAGSSDSAAERQRSRSAPLPPYPGVEFLRVSPLAVRLNGRDAPPVASEVAVGLCCRGKFRHFDAVRRNAWLRRTFVFWPA